jgi:ribonuclease E
MALRFVFFYYIPTALNFVTMYFIHSIMVCLTIFFAVPINNSVEMSDSDTDIQVAELIAEPSDLLSKESSAPQPSEPLQSAPLQSAPLQSAPLQSAPLQSAPLLTQESLIPSTTDVTPTPQNANPVDGTNPNDSLLQPSQITPSSSEQVTKIESISQTPSAPPLSEITPTAASTAASTAAATTEATTAATTAAASTAATQ